MIHRLADQKLVALAALGERQDSVIGRLEAKCGQYANLVMSLTNHGGDLTKLNDITKRVNETSDEYNAVQDNLKAAFLNQDRMFHHEEYPEGAQTLRFRS